MRFIKLALAALSLGLVAASASASLDSPVSGTEYHTLERAQPAEQGKKVEVVEFFMYSCPHCNAFDPDLSEWVKAQGDNIVFKRVPLAFQDGQILHQKLYYALEAMGKTEETHKRIFHAIHIERKQLNDEAAIADFVAGMGVDRAKFLSAFNSFGVQAKLRQAAQLAADYKIEGVPTVAIDGRFEISPSITQSGIGDKPEHELFGDTLKIGDWLVAKVARERKLQARK